MLGLGLGLGLSNSVSGGFSPSSAFQGASASYFLANESTMTFDSGTDIDSWSAVSGENFDFASSGDFAGFDSTAFSGRGGIGNGSGGVASLIADADSANGTSQALWFILEVGLTVSSLSDILGFGSSSAMNLGNRIQVQTNNALVWDDERGTNIKYTLDTPANNRINAVVMQWTSASTVEIYVNSKTKNATDLAPDDNASNGVLPRMHVGRKSSWDSDIKFREFGFNGGGLTTDQINNLMDYAASEYGVAI